MAEASSLIKSGARKAGHWVLESSPWLWIALALVLRLAFVLALKERFYQIDEGGFTAPAWQWASLHILGSDGQPSVAPPVPCGFFALFFLLGRRLLFPRLGQALLSVATAIGIGRMTEDLSGSGRAGRLALALSSVYPFFIYYSGILMSETTYVACVVAAVWAAGSSLESGSPEIAALSGLCWALAALARTEAVPIAAALWVLGAALCLSSRWNWKAWVLALLCWALPLAGWAARNHGVCGRWTLDTHGGFTLLVATRYYDLDQVDTAYSAAAIQQSALAGETRGLPAAERDRAYFRSALDFMRENPSTTLRQWAGKFANFWRFYPRTDKVYIETATSHPGVGLGRGALVAISLLFEPALILGGLLGLWRAREWPELWPAFAFVLGSTAVHTVVVSMMRYRLAVMPFLIMGLALLASEKSEI